MDRRLGIIVACVVLALAACTSSNDSGGSAAPGGTPGTGPSTAGGDREVPPGTVRPPLDGPVPTVSGPITGGTYGVPYNPMPPELGEEHGYTEEEFFISGSATSYAPEGELDLDGEWFVTPAGTADYETRILVRRPADPADFNGVVLVEWLNVSAGRDSDPDFGFLQPWLFEEGFAYVGVSAQATGVSGGPTRLEVPGVPREAIIPLKEWDPVRYEPLHHPGDEFSYDIYTQVARLVLDRGDGDPLGGLPVEHVIAMGESQSAGRMTTYANAIQPETGAFDGLFVHSRGSGGAPLNADPAAASPTGVTIREDLDVPVFLLATETDLLRLGYVAARQRDTGSIVTWEVAGTAHADRSTIDYGAESGRVWLTGADDVDPAAPCGQINDGPQAEVVRAGMASFVRWVREGTPMPSAARIEVAEGDIVVDDLGNARGGIRTPPVDAPVSVLSGKGNPSSVFCSLFGQEAPLTAEQLAAEYPTHDDYVARVRESADAAVGDGFLLRADADAMIAAAEDAPVPG
jgi:hypothetical protein